MNRHELAEQATNTMPSLQHLHQDPDESGLVVLHRALENSADPANLLEEFASAVRQIVESGWCNYISNMYGNSNS